MTAASENDSSPKNPFAGLTAALSSKAAAPVQGASQASTAMSETNYAGDDGTVKVDSKERFWQLQIEAVYRRHNADKLASIPELLEKYKGREAILYKKVCQRYDLDPSKLHYENETPAKELKVATREEFWQIQIEAIYQKCSIDKVPDVAKLMEKHRGQEASLYKKVCQRYELDPNSLHCDEAEMDASKELVETQKKEAGRQAAEEEATRSAVEADNRKAEEEKGVRRKTAEKDDEAAKAEKRDASNETIETQTKQDSNTAKVDSKEDFWRVQIEAIYRRRNPHKLASIPNLMAKYKGNEVVLYRKICQRYDLDAKKLYHDEAAWEGEDKDIKDDDGNDHSATSGTVPSSAGPPSAGAVAVPNLFGASDAFSGGSSGGLFGAGTGGGSLNIFGPTGTAFSLFGASSGSSSGSSLFAGKGVAVPSLFGAGDSFAGGTSGAGSSSGISSFGTGSGGSGASMFALAGARSSLFGSSSEASGSASFSGSSLFAGNASKGVTVPSLFGAGDSFGGGASGAGSSAGITLFGAGSVGNKASMGVSLFGLPTGSSGAGGLFRTLSGGDTASATPSGGRGTSLGPDWSNMFGAETGGSSSSTSGPATGSSLFGAPPAGSSCGSLIAAETKGSTSSSSPFGLASNGASLLGAPVGSAGGISLFGAVAGGSSASTSRSTGNAASLFGPSPESSGSSITPLFGASCGSLSSDVSMSTSEIGESRAPSKRPGGAADGEPPRKRRVGDLSRSHSELRLAATAAAEVLRMFSGRLLSERSDQSRAVGETGLMPLVPADQSRKPADLTVIWSPAKAPEGAGSGTCETSSAVAPASSGPAAQRADAGAPPESSSLQDPRLCAKLACLRRSKLEELILMAARHDQQLLDEVHRSYDAASALGTLI
eukprot:TRINITY_DN23674_c0_g1_i1.p1 TRINITY_DN23674_c0_g1~~TRINITY_DN23674_c0_g1_i1.p1  ORF type:complete len:887 (+),score=204.25 TRINITY_DN23674_c0_g1_i1:75-2735(+)